MKTFFIKWQLLFLTCCFSHSAFSVSDLLDWENPDYENAKAKDGWLRMGFLQDGLINPEIRAWLDWSEVDPSSVAQNYPPEQVIARNGKKAQISLKAYTSGALLIRVFESGNPVEVARVVKDRNKCVWNWNNTSLKCLPDELKWEKKSGIYRYKTVYARENNPDKHHLFPDFCPQPPWCGEGPVESPEFSVEVIENQPPTISWYGTGYEYDPTAASVNIKLKVTASDFTTNKPENAPASVSFFIQYGNDQKIEALNNVSLINGVYQGVISNVKTGRNIKVFARAYDGFHLDDQYAEIAKVLPSDINLPPSSIVNTSKLEFARDESIIFEAIISDDADITDDKKDLYKVHICYQKENEQINCTITASPGTEGDNPNVYRSTINANRIGIGKNIKIWAQVEDPLGLKNDYSTVSKKTIHISNNYLPRVAIVNTLESEYRKGDRIEVFIEASDVDGQVNKIEVNYGSGDKIIGCFSLSPSTSCQSMEKIEEKEDEDGVKVGRYRFEWASINQTTNLFHPNNFLYVSATDNKGATRKPQPRIQTTIRSLAKPPAPTLYFGNAEQSHDGDGRFEVLWNDIGAEQYIIESCQGSVEFCSNISNWYKIRETDKFNTGILEAGLRNGDYHYRVTACAVTYSDRLCGNPSQVRSITVLHAAPSFPFLDNYLFEATPQTNAGDYSIRWALLDEEVSGAVIDYYQLDEKLGNLQCETPDNDGYCENEWLPLDINSANFDEESGTMTLHFNNRDIGKGIYSYRLQACNHQSGCTTGPIIEVAILPPFIDNLSISCEGSCLKLAGKHFDNEASVKISTNDNNSDITIPSWNTYWRDQGFMEIQIGNDTSLSRSIRNQGMTLSLTNPNGSTFSTSLEPNQQSSSISLSDTDPVISKELDMLYVTVGSKVYALDIETGELINNSAVGWPFTVPGSTLTTPIVNQIDGNFYVGSTDKNLYAIDESGFLYWKTETEGAIVSEPALDEKSIIYAGSMDGKLYALHPENGNIAWLRHTDQSGINQKPRLQGSDLIYVTTTQGRVHLINRRELDHNTLVWESKDDSLMAYEIKVGNWQPNRLYNLKDYLAIAKLYRLLLQPELSPNREILTFWTFALDQGTPLGVIAEAFLGSKQGIENFPYLAPLGSDRNFLEELYKRAFGETGVDTDGNNDTSIYRNLVISETESYSFEALLTLLQNGTDRSDIVLLFTRSIGYNDAVIHILNAQYDYFYEEDFSWSLSNCDVATCDTDGDGLYDLWEELHFGDIADVDADTVINGKPVSESFIYDENPCQDEGCFDTETVPEMAQINAPEVDDNDVKASDQVGTVAGNFRVTEAGAATYSVPIIVAQGVAGVTPELSLSYTSQGSNGFVGYGFGVNGLSSINRCRQTKAVNNTSKPITFDTNDRFCFEGYQLINISGGYHANGSVYQTEINNEAKMTYYHDGNGGYFEMKRKDGSISYFGKTEDSKQQISKGNAVLVWGISSFKDSVGNASDITYHYLPQLTGNTNNYLGYNNILTIDEVRYAYGKDSNAGAKIKFEYSYDRPDPLGGFTSGEYFGTSRRLNKIISYSNTEEIRRFNLQYKVFDDRVNTVSKLKTIEECIGENYCKTGMLTFGWTEPRVNLDDPIINHTGTDDVGIYKYQLADINGDGAMDIIWLQWRYKPQADDTDHRLNFLISKNGKLEKTNFYNPNNPNNGDRYIRYGEDIGDEDVNLEVIDYNNDGRQDALVYRQTGNNWLIYLSTPMPDGSWRLSQVPIIIPPDSNNNKLSKSAQFIDTNGNGLQDAVYTLGDQVFVRELVKDISQQESSNTRYHFSPNATELTITDHLDPILTHNGDIRLSKYLLVSGGVQDFNGDGIVDVTIKRKPIDPIDEWLNRNKNDPKETVVVGHYLKGSDGTLTRYGSQLSTDNKRARRFTPSFSDINGDGLTDVLFNENDKWKIKLSTGKGFTEAVHVITLDKHTIPRLVDFNQDGFQDLLWVDGVAHVKFWRPERNQFDSEPYNFGYFDDNKNVIFADLNGDATGDMIEVADGSETFNVYKASKVVGDVWENGQIHYQGDVQSGKAHMITSIDNGFGSRTDITYDSLSTTDHYTNLHIEQNHANDLLTESTNHRMPYTSHLAPEYYARVNGNLNTPEGHQTLGKDHQEPIIDLRAPVYVVTDVSSTMPTAGSEPGLINHNDRGMISYYYSDAKLQASGRGLLGFSEVKTLDNKSQMLTTTHYRQDFPFIGMAWKTEKQILGGNLLSSAINHWEIHRWNGDQNNPPQPPYRLILRTSTETGFDPETGIPLKRLTSHTDSTDSDGNILDMRVVTEDLNRSEIFTTTTSNTYQSGSEAQWFGRLKTSTVTQQRPTAPDVIRTSAFTYYDDTHWMIKTETVEPGSAHQLTTHYTYDDVGNKLSVITEGIGDIHGNKQTRGKTYVYDTDRARYLTETYNIKGQLLQSINPSDRTASGEIKKITDGNGVSIQAVFGKFGTKVFEWNASGSFSSTRIYNGTGNYCDYPTQYHLEIESAGGSRSFICYDSLGREIKKGKLGFHGFEWYVTKTAYDHLGNMRYQTLPYTEDEDIPQWVTYSYDHLGRKTRTDFPDSTFEEIDYQGFDSVFTNRLGDSRTDEKNVLGELIKTTDALNGTITYTYDSAGNILTTTTDGPEKAAGVTGAVTVSMNYGPDLHARWKTSMNDPDKGHWQYRYNAFGELIEQIDGRSRSTVMHRDNLGREVCRIDYLDISHTAIESSSQWFYDTAPKPDNGNGQTIAIGQLHRVVKSDTACNSSPSYNANVDYDYEQVYYYDAISRNYKKDTLIDGEAFTTQLTYDEHGRIFQSYDAAGNGRGTRNIYNEQGYLSEIRDAQVYNNAQAVYRKILEMDASGNVIQEFSHNGMTTTRSYDPIHGMITEIYTALEGISVVQDLIMHYDALGNLLRRDDNVRGHYESFCYDSLNRMTGSALNAQCTEGDIQYDSFGNFINKPNVGDYTYGEQAGPHAVTSTEKDGVITTYQYDANGNMVSDSTGRQLVYSQFDKPVQITKGQNTIEFEYGPSRSRYKRTDTDGENTTTTLYLGNVEIITRNGVREAKRYIAGNTISTDTALDEGKAPQTASFQFMFKDHLGSVDIILTEAPNEVGGQIHMSFDAWGLRRNATTLEEGFNLVEIINQSITATTRGFTGHEMLDLVGLIHMNGRVYDPLLGRFLSADPFIQSPTETQSYNRYAYLWNNPLSSTDPTGYWDNRKMKGIFGSLLQTIGSVLLHTPFAPLGAAMIVGGSILTGKAMGNVAQGVAIGVFSAVAFYGIGQYFKEAAAANANLGMLSTFGGLELTAGQVGAQVASHAVVGGVIAEMQGGNFGHGFFSAGFTKALGGAFLTGNNTAANTVKSALIGGTASKLTGGKFANGAAMGAFQYAFNQAMSSALAKNLQDRSACNGRPCGNRPKGKTLAEQLGVEYAYGSYAGGSAITPAGGANAGINGQFFSDGSSDTFGVAGVGWGWDIGGGAETNFAVYLGEGDAGVTSWLGRFDSYHISAFGFTASYFYGGDWYGGSFGATTDGFGFSCQINQYHSLSGNKNE